MNVHALSRPPLIEARVMRLVARFVSRDTALPIAAIIAFVASAADGATTADATFTLFYLIPIALAVWFRSKRAGYVIVGQVMAMSTLVRVRLDHPRPHAYFLIWNFVVELGLYLVFVHLFDVVREHLEHETERRKAAIDQLRHADRLTTVGKLAAGIAHELGTPMGVISGRGSLIASGLSIGAEAQAAGSIIVEQVDRMLVIIRHLLDFARQGGTQKQATDVTALTNDVATLLGPSAQAAGVDIVVVGAPVVAPLNPAEIQQVLCNLVTNSVHAMPRGGRIEMGVHTERTRENRRRNDENFAVVTVRDEGTGIAADVLPRIFDPFFTTKEVGQGTGLGLSISYGIVSDHNGFIRVHSRQGEGTSVSVYLPM